MRGSLILRSAIVASRRMSIRRLRRIRELDNRDAVRQLQRRLEAVRKPRRDVGPHHDAVHHHVDVVLDLLVERGRIRDLVEFAVHFHALKAALLQIREFLAILALAAADHGREQVKPRPLWAAPARGPPSGSRSGFRWEAPSRANRARRRAPRGAAYSRKSR